MNTQTSFRPYGVLTLSALFPVNSLPNVGNKSSRWQVLDAFLHETEATAMRIYQGTSGLLIMSGIPDRPDTGAFYVYNEIDRKIYMVEFETRDNFYATDFDLTVAAYDLMGLVMKPTTPLRPALQLVVRNGHPVHSVNVQDAVTSHSKHNQKRKHFKKSAHHMGNSSNRPVAHHRVPIHTEAVS